MPILDNIVGAAVNTGAGMLMAGINDRRQIKQQRKLNQLSLDQYGSQLDMLENKELSMWENTSYPAQLQMMKKAGLSPGLMYGGSGAGGSTVGGGASAGTAAAPAGGNEIMGIQLMGAQKKLLEAQADAAEAGAEKTRVDTGTAEAEREIRTLEAGIAENTYYKNIDMIYDASAKLLAESQSAAIKAQLDNETYETKVGTIQAELIGLRIANELKREQINLTQEQVTQVVESVKQKWAEIAVKQGQLDLDKFVNDIANSTKLAVETVSGIAKSVLTKGAVKNTTIENSKTINSTRNFY